MLFYVIVLHNCSINHVYSCNIQRENMCSGMEPPHKCQMLNNILCWKKQPLKLVAYLYFSYICKI